MTNLTLSNPSLMTYLDGRSNVVPVGVFTELLLAKPSQKETALDTLRDELKKGIETALGMGIEPGYDFISNQLVDIAACVVALKADSSDLNAVHQAAKCFRSLWQHAKKLGGLSRGG